MQLRFVVSYPSRVWCACHMSKELFLWKRSVSMLGIESMISSTQWAPHYPFRKWHGWILCWTPSSPSPDLLEYKFWPNQFLLVRYLEYPTRCSGTHPWWLLLREMSTSVRFRSGLHQFPGCSFSFRGVFRIVSLSCSAFPGRTQFTKCLERICRE